MYIVQIQEGQTSMDRALGLLALLASWALVAWLSISLHGSHRRGWLSLGFDEPTFISECLHPMGGGKVKRGGTFPALNDSFLRWG